LILIDDLKEPETFENAYYHPSFEETIKLREEISKGIDEMKGKGIHEKIFRLELPIEGSRRVNYPILTQGGSDNK
jgi:hypothetical protein